MSSVVCNNYYLTENKTYLQELSLLFLSSFEAVSSLLFVLGL